MTTKPKETKKGKGSWVGCVPKNPPKIMFVIKGEVVLDGSMTVMDALTHLQEALQKVNELASASCHVSLPACEMEI